MARGTEKNGNMRETRVKQIRSEALRLFSTQGLFATKIQDIAKSVNMSQGLIYHYYKSKEDIFIELINDALDKMNEAVLELSRLSIPADEKIKAAIKELLNTIETSDDFSQTCRLIAQAANTNVIPNDAQLIVNIKRNLPYTEIAKIMEEGQKDGKIFMGNTLELSVAFWTAINGIAIYKATNKDNAIVPAPETIIRMFIKE